MEKGGKRTLKGPMRRVSFLDFDRFCLKGMHQREIIELTTHNNLSMITNNYQKHTTTRSKRVEEMIKHVFFRGPDTLYSLSNFSAVNSMGGGPRFEDFRHGLRDSCGWLATT